MLKMDTAHSSKTLASVSQFTWNCTPEDSNHHAKRFRNYKISYGWMYFHLVGSCAYISQSGRNEIHTHVYKHFS